MTDSPAPVPAPTPADSGEIDAFTSQARWLLEWHNKRNDGFATRTVALLGFTGVILALLPRGLDLNGGIDATRPIKGCLMATAALLLLTAVFCLLVLAPQQTGFPSVSQLRKQWATYSGGTGTARPRAKITESLLHGASNTASSPVELAMEEANQRGKWFKCAVFSLAGAITSLTALVIQVFWQM